jgi:hypothetical protein
MGLRINVPGHYGIFQVILEYPRPSLWSHHLPPDHMWASQTISQTITHMAESWPRLYMCLTHNVPGHSQISQTITVKPPSSPRPYMGSQRMSQVITVHPQSCPRPYMCLVSNIPGHSSKYPRPLPHTVIMLQTKYRSHHNVLGNYWISQITTPMPQSCPRPNTGG